MKIFQSIEDALERFGIYRPPPNQPCQRWSLRSELTMAYLIVFCILCCIFIAFQAEDITEYSDAIFATSVAIAIVGVLAINLWKMPNIFQLIDNLQELIESRKSMWIWMENPEVSGIRESEKLFTIAENLPKTRGLFYQRLWTRSRTKILIANFERKCWKQFLYNSFIFDHKCCVHWSQILNAFEYAFVYGLCPIERNVEFQYLLSFSSNIYQLIISIQSFLH